MRRVLMALTLCLAALAAACGGNQGGDLPAVTGSPGSDPLISLPAGHPPAGLVVRTLAPGNGRVVRPSDYVLIDVAGKVWAGDRLVVDSYAARKPQALPVGAGLPAWRHLAGQRVGSRVLMVVPPRDGFGQRGNPAINVTGTDTLVFVFDILAAFPPGARASGATLPALPAQGLPRVAMSARGPLIAVPARTPPAHLISRVLIRGRGPAVTAGGTVVTQYTGVIWHTGRVFTSSWRQGGPQAFELSPGQVIPGWVRGLAGQRAGSRVLLVIPPGLGYGSAGDPPLVTGKDTLVYVVDILAAVRG